MEQYRQEQAAKRLQEASKPFRPPTMAEPMYPWNKPIDLTDSPSSGPSGPEGSGSNTYPGQKYMDIRPTNKHAKATTIKVFDDEVPPKQPSRAPAGSRPNDSSSSRSGGNSLHHLMQDLHIPSAVSNPIEKYAQSHKVFGKTIAGWSDSLSQPRPQAPHRPQGGSAYNYNGQGPYGASGRVSPSKVKYNPLGDEPEPSGSYGPVIDPAERDRQLQEMISNMVDLSDVDPSKSRIEGLKCELMPHQIQGVDWMVQREKGKDKGGILADDMGLGKTIQMLALIVSNRPTLETSTIRYVEEAAAANKKASKKADGVEEPPKKEEVELKSKATLILAPLAVIKQWEKEINDKSDCGLKVLVHHGTSRAKDAAVLQKYDVVISTYTTAAAEWGNTIEGQRWAEKKGKGKPRKAAIASAIAKEDNDDDDDVYEDDDDEDEGKNDLSKEPKTVEDDDDSENEMKGPGRAPPAKTPAKKPSKAKAAPPSPLFDSNWLRVVLDEAQNIKNHRTKAALSSFALGRKAHAKWCLSGTPIQNDSYELFSLIHFLGIPPFNEYRNFKEKIGEPLKSTNQNRVNWGLKRLRVVLGAIMLRRTKDAEHDGKKILQLPPRNVQVVETDFDDPSEREFYTSLEGKMRDALKRDTKMNRMGALVMLLRLRQACSHPALTMKSITQDASAAVNPAPKTQVKSEDRSAGAGDDDEDDLVNALQGLSVNKTCDICRTPLADSTQSRCPECTATVARSKASGQDWLQPMKTSTKVRLMMEKLKEIRDTAPGEKTIVFSQFTTFLDLIEPFLRAEKLKYVRYDGSMRPEQREQALDDIKTKDACKIILISFKAGSTGLNLTCCSRVLLMDLWWNPQIEEQAFDRAHRLGQNRPVFIYKLSVKNSVEERLLAIQQKKRDLANSALTGEKLKKGKNQLSWNELLYLFNAAE